MNPLTALPHLPEIVYQQIEYWIAKPLQGKRRFCPFSIYEAHPLDPCDKVILTNSKICFTIFPEIIEGLEFADTRINLCKMARSCPCLYLGITEVHNRFLNVLGGKSDDSPIY